MPKRIPFPGSDEFENKLAVDIKRNDKVRSDYLGKKSNTHCLVDPKTKILQSELLMLQV